MTTGALDDPPDPLGGSAEREPGRVRLAVAGDVPELVRLRGVMFEAMGIDLEAAGCEWEVAAAEVFRAEIEAGRMVGAVVDAPDGSGDLAASGVVQFESRLPGPSRTSPLRAYLSSMSTDPRWRRRGFASEIMRLLLDVAEKRGAMVISLHATEEGRLVYERHGFEVLNRYPEMRLRLDG